MLLSEMWKFPAFLAISLQQPIPHGTHRILVHNGRGQERIFFFARLKRQLSEPLCTFHGILCQPRHQVAF